MFGPNPAYGMFIRHVKNIKLSDIEFSFINEDERPAFYLNDVKGVYMFHVTPQQKENTSSIILKDVHDFSIWQSGGFENKKLANAANVEL